MGSAFADGQIPSKPLEVQVDGDMLRLRLRMPAEPQANHPSGMDLPRSSREWIERMLDSSRHGIAFKDPQVFVEWLDAITEPQFMTALATASIEPGSYNKAMNGLVRPETARNWAEFTNPMLYMRWMITGANPDFYRAIIERFTDPGKMTRWARYGAAGAFTAPAKAMPTGTSVRPDPTPELTASNPGALAANWMAGFLSGIGRPPVDTLSWKRLPKTADTPLRRY
jgi:hypothetical protein